MGYTGIDPEIFYWNVKFLSEIGMIPILIHKEQNGYLLNSLLLPSLSAAQDLFFNGVYDFWNHRQNLDDFYGNKNGPLWYSGSSRVCKRHII